MPRKKQTTGKASGPTKAIGTEIRVARIRKDWTQQDLAQAAGISAKHLSQIETGVAGKFSVDVFKRLCEALEADANQLMGLPVRFDGP